ncbi:MAG TPA: hypothetical protein VF753_07715, partial [Terriglobales bacterium]
MKKPGISLVIFCACFALAAWAQSQPQTTHTIVKFNAPSAGTGSGQGTQAFGIVAGNTIMGSYIDSDNVSHGFLRSADGKFTEFDPSGSQGTYPAGINSSSEITGIYHENGVYHGFLRSADGKFTKIDAPEAGTGSSQGTQASDINSNQVVTGLYIDSNSTSHGFLRSAAGDFTTFDDPHAGTGSNQGTLPTSLDGLNDLGAVVGFYIDSNFANHGFLRYPSGKFTTIDPSGSDLTLVFGINSKSTSVGTYFDSAGSEHGFVRTTDGTITSFDAPHAPNGTEPVAINTLGATVGAYFDKNFAAHGFVRAPNGGITEFSVSGAGTGFNEGTFPNSITPDGAISGYYVDADN